MPTPNQKDYKAHLFHFVQSKNGKVILSHILSRNKYDIKIIETVMFTEEPPDKPEDYEIWKDDAKKQIGASEHFLIVEESERTIGVMIFFTANLKEIDMSGFVQWRELFKAVKFISI